jgi:HD-GYP domain-containing protein (c-di-GMP phosphodiesterase class II)
MVSSKTKLIKELLNLGIELTSQKVFDVLLEKIVDGCQNFTMADAVTIYLLNEDEKSLDFAIAHTGTLGIKMGGKGERIEWPPLKLYDDRGDENRNNVAAVCALESKMFNFSDVYKVDEFDFSGARKFDEMNNYRTKSMIVVPMLDNENNIIGVLQLINKLADNGEIVAFDKNDELIANSISSLGAVSIHNHKLVKNLEELLEAFIKSIADTLEEKSKYTEHHVQRVATIVDMIAKAINRDEEIFKDVRFSENELKELNMAAFLHDIGKIITPEAVVDKATRLQTIVDRMDNIKLRFELLKEQSYNKFLVDSDKESHEERLAKLQDDLEFLSKCNTAPFVSDEDADRVKKIGEIEYEVGREKKKLLNEDEINNLCIKKGTLNNKEREIINNHVVVSYKMLKNLPFPKKYKNIPLIAGSHHKFVDGQKGYAAKELMGKPLGLKERILAVSDVFEALTSPERPYKKPYTLSESFKIISYMVKDGQLDKDIIKVILNSKVYKEFADSYLDSSQIDEVDEEIISCMA